MNNSNSHSKKLRLNCDITNRDSEMAGASSYASTAPNAAQLSIDESEVFSNWHARQITKCINDNAINRVLDSYLRIFQEVNTLNLQTSSSGTSVVVRSPPPPPVRPNRSSNRFEESAILMAISEHGLQQNVVPVSSDECSTTGNNREPSVFSSIKLTSTLTQPTSSSSSSSQSTIAVPSTSQNSVSSSSLSSTTTISNFNDLDIVASNEILTSNPSSIESNDDIDFMEAAVAVAIQNKGLTPYSVSMSPTR